jgi:cbb3-type cytochrome oxidase subunit 3
MSVLAEVIRGAVVLFFVAILLAPIVAMFIRERGRRQAEQEARKRYDEVERAATILSRPLPPLEPERSRAIQDRAAAAAFLLSQEARCVPRYEP